MVEEQSGSACVGRKKPHNYRSADLQPVAIEIEMSGAGRAGMVVSEVVLRLIVAWAAAKSVLKHF